MDKIIEDKELGRLVIREHARAKRLIFRSKSDAIYISVPPGISQKEIKNAIEKLRSKLLETKQKIVRKRIDFDFRMETEHLTLSLVPGKQKSFLLQSEFGKVRIVCPPSTNFDDESLQNWLRKVIEESFRQQAKAMLPSRLYALSKTHKLEYTGVKINSSRGRWGSCSATKNINLSYFLILLPSHLIDYVLLHELCHTIEMNHSERFWHLLNEQTAGQALALRAELKKHQIAWEGS